MKMEHFWKAGFGTFIGGVLSTAANVAIFLINRDLHIEMTIAGFNPAAFLWLGGAAGTMIGGVLAARSSDQPQSSAVTILTATDQVDVLLNANLSDETHEAIEAEYLESIRDQFKLKRALDAARILNQIALEDVQTAAKIAKIDTDSKDTPSVSQLVDYVRAHRKAVTTAAEPVLLPYPTSNALVAIPGPYDPGPVSPTPDVPAQDGQSESESKVKSGG